MRYQFVYPDYKMWSYEEEFCKEILRNYSSNFRHFENGIEIRTDEEIPHFQLENMPFFKRIIVRSEDSKEVIEPRGRVFESISSNGYESKGEDVSRKQARYMAHGLHEYKGKYYPQLVSSILSILQVEEGDTILDPFSGSGTTLYEGRLHSLNTVGVDVNPFSVYLSNTKLSTFDIDLKDIEEFEKEFNKQMLDEEEYSLHEEGYLGKWFEEPILKEIRGIHKQIREIGNEEIERILLITLSDLLREVSHQDKNQIRVRRAKEIPENVEVSKKFLERLEENREKIANSQKVKQDYELDNTSKAVVGDSASLTDAVEDLDYHIDHIVCSPPYATGLPYVDTYRLSLYTLDLLDKDNRRDLERQVIGNREIGKKEKRKLEKEFLDNYDDLRLPDNVKELIKKIHDLNKDADVGFRRKNKASLLYKYFRDMRDVLEEGYEVLPEGGNFVLVVGRNSTKAGDDKEEIIIPTEDFLYDIGEMLGYEKSRLVEKKLESTSTREVHNNNSIQEEKILFLEK